CEAPRGYSRGQVCAEVQVERWARERDLFVGVSAPGVPVPDVYREVAEILNQCTGEKLAERVFHILSDADKFAALRLEHAFNNAVIEEDQEFVVETVDVQ